MLASCGSVERALFHPIGSDVEGQFCRLSLIRSCTSDCLGRCGQSAIPVITAFSRTRIRTCGDGWVHEVKFDGYRIQAHKLSSRVVLASCRQSQLVSLPNIDFLCPRSCRWMKRNGLVTSTAGPRFRTGCARTSHTAAGQGWAHRPLSSLRSWSTSTRG